MDVLGQERNGTDGRRWFLIEATVGAIAHLRRLRARRSELYHRAFNRSLFATAVISANTQIWEVDCASQIKSPD